MRSNIFKLIIIISSLIFPLLVTNSIITYPVSASKTQNSQALIARISNITINYASPEYFNLSAEYDIYNPNSVNYPITISNCGIGLVVKMNSLEDKNGSFNVGYACNQTSSIVTLKPGLNIQSLNDAAIFLNNWNPTGNDDLPLAQYNLNIDHSSFNMTSIGATITYNGTGQFFITYDQNSYTFWNFNPANYQTHVAVSTGIPGFYNGQPSTTTTTNNSSNTSNSGLELVITIVLIVLIILGTVYKRIDTKKGNFNEKPAKKTNSDAGTFQKVELERRCPACGNILSESDVFCPYCGNRA